MERRIFRSRALAATVLVLWTATVAAPFPQAGGAGQAEFQKAFQAGKKLYEDGEHKDAIINLQQALLLAKEKGDVAEACFFLCLSYYALGDQDSCRLYLKKLFEAQPAREIESQMYPSGFVIVFYQLKSEAAKAAETKPVAMGGKAAAGTQVKKKKFPWLIVAGAAVVVGVVAVILLTKKKGSDKGSISVTSSPSGAKVSLDGNDTGLATACTISNVSPGGHGITLVKDGYADHTANVTVTAGQTASLNAVLTKNSITVTSPAGGTTWAKGNPVDIKWQVGLSAVGSGPAAVRRFSGASGRKPSGPPEDDPGFATSGAEGPPLSTLQTRAVLDIAAVKIELFKGTQSAAVIIPETPNTGLYVWQVSDQLAEGADYKVRIYCSTDPSVYGESGAFSVTAGTITVVEPTAGSVWGKGATYGVKWMGFISGNVKIDLYKWTSFVQTIVADAANTGLFSWAVPLTMADGADYRIRVSSVLRPGTYGESDFFSIGAAFYEFAAKWGGYGGGDGQFYNPHGIALDASGFVYVADTNNHRVQKFDANGVFLTKWGSFGTGDGRIGCTGGIAVDASGNVYVTELCNDRVQKFSASGAFLAKWGATGSGNGQFNAPAGIAVDRFGNVFVTDQANDRVQKFDVNGAFVAKWGSRGSGDGFFYSPDGIAVDGSGYVYVADLNNFRIQKFTTTGVFVAKWGGSGGADGQFAGPAGIAVDGSGNIFVAEYGGNRIQKFAPNGTFLGKWGSTGTGDGQFNMPEGIAVDPWGNVYVTEINGHRVQKFRQKSGSPFSVGFVTPADAISRPSR
jgi:sugar lactone lactonase YvrE